MYSGSRDPVSGRSCIRSHPHSVGQLPHFPTDRVRQFYRQMHDTEGETRPNAFFCQYFPIKAALTSARWGIVPSTQTRWLTAVKVNRRSNPWFGSKFPATRKKNGRRFTYKKQKLKKGSTNPQRRACVLLSAKRLTPPSVRVWKQISSGVSSCPSPPSSPPLTPPVALRRELFFGSAVRACVRVTMI